MEEEEEEEEEAKMGGGKGRLITGEGSGKEKVELGNFSSLFPSLALLVILRIVYPRRGSAFRILL